MIVDVIRARLHTTCNDPTETLQLNQRPVIESHCTVIRPVSRGTTGPATDRSRGERGKLREGGDALMRQGKHSSDVCLPLPNIPATTDQHFTVAPCTSPITLFSMYNVMVCPKVHPINIMVLTLNSFPYAL